MRVNALVSISQGHLNQHSTKHTPVSISMPLRDIFGPLPFHVRLKGMVLVLIESYIQTLKITAQHKSQSINQIIK